MMYYYPGMHGWAWALMIIGKLFSGASSSSPRSL